VTDDRQRETTDHATEKCVAIGEIACAARSDFAYNNAHASAYLYDSAFVILAAAVAHFYGFSPIDAAEIGILIS